MEKNFQERRKRKRRARPQGETEKVVTRTEEYHQFAKKSDRKSNAGRKPKYEPELSPKLAESYAMDGFNDKEIAQKLGIHTATLYDWINKYPEFSEALKRGKEPVNADIKAAMLKTAFGFYVTEEETVTTYDPQTREMTSVRKAAKKRYISPNPTMQIFLAKNRMPELFKDVNRREGDNRNSSGPGITIADLIAEDQLESEGAFYDKRDGGLETEDQD